MLNEFLVSSQMILKPTYKKCQVILMLGEPASKVIIVFKKDTKGLSHFLLKST